MKKKDKSLLSRFFSHNITLLVLAFLLSMTGWFVINVNTDATTTGIIDNIPVNLELPDIAKDEGLNIYGGDNLKASVTVEGNPVIVGSLSATDIQVVANQNSSMIASGTYTLALTPKKTGLKTDYEFVTGTLSPSTITVFLDREKTAQFDIENKITVDLEDKQNHYANTVLSQNKVMVSGPETQVNQIASVAVTDTLSGKSETKEEELVFLDEDGEELDLSYVSTDLDSVEVTITVLPIDTIDLSVDVTNAPSNYPKIKISPSSVKIAGAQDVLDGIEDKKLSVGTLDFTKLSNESISQKFDISLPSGCKVVGGEASANVSVDLSAYDTATVTAKVSNNLDSSVYTAEFFSSNNAQITICGPQDMVSEITASDVTAVTDFNKLLDKMKSGNTLSLSVPLKITLNSEYTDCWVYGSYTVDVNVTKK